ncbi:MAG: sulfate ABC transporter permease subunit CysT [Burkholderiales bacterium]|nr:sulfate ABC transporter permease subunit CysT [Anaerolineae bacterium]
MTDFSLPSRSEVSVKLPQASYGAWGLRFAALTYLLAFVAIPVAVIFVQGLRPGLDTFLASLTRPDTAAAITLSVWTSVLMTVINTVMGTLTAYVLVVYRFPGKALFNALIDVPFAVPTLVIGVMLVMAYGPQTFIGAFFSDLGIRIVFDTPGIVLALLFVGYPFVIRTVQPVLLQMDANQQESAHTIGASAWTTFFRVVFPVLRPAIIAGALLSFARSLGEFGSIVIISGNIPMRTQTATVYIYTQIEEGNVQAASGASAVLLFVSFAVTIGVDLFLRRRQRHA